MGNPQREIIAGVPLSADRSSVRMATTCSDRFEDGNIVDRPKQFAEHQFVGDKRSQIVYDVDALTDAESHLIDELMTAQTCICFGPDTLAEARNRGYRLHGA